MVGPPDILLFTSITFPQENLSGKLLLVLNCDHLLKLCIKKKRKQKTSPRRLSGTMNFGSPNLTKPKESLGMQ